MKIVIYISDRVWFGCKCIVLKGSEILRDTVIAAGSIVSGKQTVHSHALPVALVLYAFNESRYVAEAVRSMFAQDYANLEIVLSDDGSTDGTTDLLMQSVSASDHVTAIRLSRSFGSHYAISAGLSSQKDGIAVEDNTSPYVNIIASREKDKDDPAYKKFVKAFQSEAVKNYINKEFATVLVPVW